MVNKRTAKLWGKVITDRNELQRLQELQKKLYKKLPDAERAAILKELLNAFGFTRTYTFSRAEGIIDIHINASRYFTTIKEKGLEIGKKVKYYDRIGFVNKITWNGHLNIRFEDGQKPRGVIVSPSGWVMALDSNTC